MSTTTVITRPLSNDIPLEIFKGNTLQHTPTPTQNDTAIDRITSVQDDSEASQHDPELSADEEARSQLARSLPPIDGGKRAWTFVFCAFIIETLTWGFPYSFGVFQEYYLTHAPFSSSSEQAINSIGNVAIALNFALMPFVIMFMRRWPHWMKSVSWGCLVIGALSLFASSFATKVWQLILLQGFMVGLTGGILFAPIVVYVNEWFVLRRGLASSIIFGGAGIGGTLFPLLIHALLTRTGGHKWTLRILALLIFVLGGAALIGIGPRVPIAPRSRGGQVRSAGEGGAGQRTDYGFLKTPLFSALTFTIVVQSLAFFPVSLYIPSYSTAIGLSTLDGTIALACFNIARVVGQVGIGELCDRMLYTHLIILSGSLSALSAFCMWGFAHNLSSLFAFVIVFGLISGGFSSLGSPASTDLVGTNPAQSGLVFGFLNIFKGGAVLVGPIIAAALHQQSVSTKDGQPVKGPQPKFGGYGFTLVEIFVGSMMAATAVGGFVVMFLRRGRGSGVGSR